MSPYRRRPKKATAHGGKLMIVLRNRHMVWIDADPETAKTYLPLLIEGMRDAAAVTWHVTGGGNADVVRLEDIVHVKYIGPKAEPPTEEKA